MIKLNLETKTKEQELIKQYLEENVNEILAEKINNGVKLVKENKTLINKKTLQGFMKYASEEAKKLAEKGSNCACIEDKVVYGWAIHYFEENEIVGNLYNEDGTDYKVESKKSITPKVESKPTPKKPEKQQASLFDLMSFDTTQNEEKVEETEETLEQETKEITIQDYYKIYHEQELNYPDVVVLTKLGDFYEAFNDNAERIAKVLDLVLTSRDVGLENKVALAGFPIHIKDKYLEKLQKYYTILIIENDKMNFYEKQEQKQQIDTNNQTFDKYLLKTISSLLDGKVVIK